MASIQARPRLYLDTAQPCPKVSYLEGPDPEPVEEHECAVELLDVVGEHVDHLAHGALAQRGLAQAQGLSDEGFSKWMCHRLRDIFTNTSRVAI